MKNVSVVNARTLAWLDLFALLPKGGIFYPEFTKEIIQHYQFQKFPQTIEEFNMDKGVEFHAGKSGQKVITKLTLFGTLIAVESRGGTDVSQDIILEILEWAKIKFGLKPPEGIRWGYVNDLYFETDFPLMDFASSPLDKLAKKTSAVVSEIWNEKLTFQPSVLTTGHDPQLRKYVLAGFTIQRRAEFRFSENHYFSEAPLPTDMHIKFLEEFEADVAASK